MNAPARAAAALAALLVFLAAAPAGADPFKVDPSIGNSTMRATFDSPLGERITAISSAITCDFDFSESGIATGKCSLPLTSISVDNEPDKTEHFQQWATNKKSDAEACRFEFEIDKAQTAGNEVEPMQVMQIRATGYFTICGRKHEKGERETLRGAVVLFPAGERGPGRVVKISVTIDGFNRDSYKVGPDWTEGWLPKFQKLARVVGHTGTIELNLFATEVLQAGAAPAGSYDPPKPQK